jgi:cobalt-precorrin-5B (C1)-methyltransferase
MTDATALRHGYTTGACATASVKAAMLAWSTQRPVETVEITLPSGDRVSFPIEACCFDATEATCSVRKDAGDDPDATQNAEIGCRVRWRPEPGVAFRRGEGVGLVTLPGLPVAVGEPAINPVPRRMMTDAVQEVLAAHGSGGGADLEVFVRGGEDIATRTLNARLGIVGGISIIGTTGRVRPFSAEAYIASIRSAVDVAVATGCQHIVLNSGGRSEAMLRAQFPDLPAQAFVQYGNWIGDALQHMRGIGRRRVTLGMMLGKAVKLAAGELDTHSRRGLWDRDFVVGLARTCGYPEALVGRIAALSLARQIGELLPFGAAEALYREIAARCHAVCAPIAPDVDLELRLHNDGAGWIACRGGARETTDVPAAT